MSELETEKNSVTNKSNTDISAYHAPQCEQLANDLYRLSVFYPHTKNYVNTYLIHTPERSLLIDSGSRDDESFFSLEYLLNHLAVDRSNLEVLIIHLHSDHIGGVERLWQPGMRVYAGVPNLLQHREENRKRFETFFPFLKRFEAKQGKHIEALQDLKAASYCVNTDIETVCLSDGDSLCVGDYQFQVLHTPGHERHELCLWEEEKGILFSGDAIIHKLYSNMYPIDFACDEVEEYFQSIRRLKTLPVNTVFAGHKDPMNRDELTEACEDVIAHHKRRMNDVLRVISQGHHELSEITYYFTYQGKRRHWEDYPVAFHWTLMVEMAAYLRHLLAKNKVKLHQTASGCIFTLTDAF